MTQSGKQPKVLDCKANDNEYLHMDFHGVLCYAIRYLDENFGAEVTKGYLQQVGKTYFSPLSKAMKKEGLIALEKHWKGIFTKEGGGFSLSYQGDTLVLNVDKCPAIAHLKEKDQLCTQRYCETTVVVNETICTQAGFGCSCEYEPGAGKCVQKFWKAKE